MTSRVVASLVGKFTDMDNDLLQRLSFICYFLLHSVIPISDFKYNSLSQAAADEVLINLDALTPRCFHDVNSFTLSCLIGGGIKKKKRPSQVVPAAADPSIISGNPSSSGDVTLIPKKSNTHKKVRA